MTAPARRLIKPTTPRTVHLLNLRGSLAAPVQAEASTEADFVRLAALCPNVVHIVSQPETFALPGRRYTPDYRIECRNGQVSYWEVKLEERIDKYRSVLDAMAAHAATKAARFFVASNRSIRRNSQHKSAQLVHRYAKANLAQDVIDHVLSTARGFATGISIADLKRRTSAPEELLFHLLARRLLTFKTRIGTHGTDLVIHPELMEQQDELCFADWLGVAPWRAHA
jgi:hypothetical protein